MSLAAKMLNLRPHLCGLNDTKELAAAADVEGHRGKGGEYYLLDFSRTLPPVKPDPHRYVNSHLYYLFRKEFVAGYSKSSLCSDAYSSFIINDPKAKEYNKFLFYFFFIFFFFFLVSFSHYSPLLVEILLKQQGFCLRKLSQNVPQIFVWFTKFFFFFFFFFFFLSLFIFFIPFSYHNFFQATLSSPPDCASLVRAMHRNGINLRYIGTFFFLLLLSSFLLFHLFFLSISLTHSLFFLRPCDKCH